MTDQQHLLDEIQRLDQETTKGPWAVGGKSVDGFTFFGEKYCDCCPSGEGSYGELIGEAPENDAEFIALARTALPQLANAVRAVMEACEVAEDIAEKSPSRMFDGEPFPAIIEVAQIRQAITDALGADHAT